jgi:subtilase-type serine protease
MKPIRRILILAPLIVSSVQANDRADMAPASAADTSSPGKTGADSKTDTQKLDIRTPGPDMANYPNSAYTLPQGGFYAEITPAVYTAKYQLNPALYDAEYFFRYGLLDRVELRLYSSGFSVQGGDKPTTGFGPLVFDSKIHLWDELKDYYLPAAGFEAVLQTTWLASPAFNTGTEPAFSFNFDQTLPGDISIEYNIGAQRFQDPQNIDQKVWDFAFQWAIQREIVEDLAFFVNGFYNATTLPRFTKTIKQTETVCDINHQTDAKYDCILKNTIVRRVVGGKSDAPNVVGAGLIWTLNDNLALYCNIGAGTNASSPPYQAYAGFAWTP